MARYLQEPEKTSAAALLSQGVELCEIATGHPAVWEHLTEVAWGSGAKRQTSTLMLFVEDGLVKLCLHDRAQGRSCWCSGASLTKALQALEAGLEGRTVEWRRDKGGKNR